MGKDYRTEPPRVYDLIKQVGEVSPETLKLAREAVGRQARMTDADRRRGLKKIVEDTALADD